MNTHAVNCAVLAGRSNLQERVLDLNYGLFYGTAFCLAPNLFLTAAPLRLIAAIRFPCSNCAFN
jgi:hypothetical protein